MHKLANLLAAKAQAMGVFPTATMIYVSVEKQKLFLFKNTEFVGEYPCSTSTKPPSCQYGSLGTPLGLHRIAEKIGEGEPLGTIFEKRLSIGRTYTPEETIEGAKGLITTRILWLDGLEEGKNRGYECGSHNRKIYIHGTNLEHKVGQPKSMGCVELANDHMLELFEQLCEGDLVLID